MHVWVADGLVPAHAATISVFDRGLRAGEGVYETLRAYGTHPFRLDAHLERAERGGAALGFDLPPRGRLAAAVAATIDANATDRDLAVRVTVTAGEVEPDDPTAPAGTGPTLVVTTHPIRDDPVAARGASAAVVPWAREVPHVKAVASIAAGLARRRAHEQGADEALLTDSRGWVLEGSYTNVFAVVRGRLVTPPVDAGLLPGVTRAVVVEIAAAQGLAVEETPVSVSDLVGADEAFLTASTREVVPLVRVAGELVGSGRPGRVTAALHEGYRAEVRREIALHAEGRAGRTTPPDRGG